MVEVSLASDLQQELLKNFVPIINEHRLVFDICFKKRSAKTISVQINAIRSLHIVITAEINNIDIIFFCRIVERLQSCAQEEIVAVYENDVFSAREFEPHIARHISSTLRIFFRLRDFKPPAEFW